MRVCVLYIKLVFPPTDIQHLRCQCRCLIPERGNICGHKLQDRDIHREYSKEYSRVILRTVSVGTWNVGKLCHSITVLLTMGLSGKLTGLNHSTIPGSIKGHARPPTKAACNADSWCVKENACTTHLNQESCFFSLGCLILFARSNQNRRTDTSLSPYIVAPVQARVGTAFRRNEVTDTS